MRTNPANIETLLMLALFACKQPLGEVFLEQFYWSFDQSDPASDALVFMQTLLKEEMQPLDGEFYAPLYHQLLKLRLQQLNLFALYFCLTTESGVHFSKNSVPAALTKQMEPLEEAHDFWAFISHTPVLLEQLVEFSQYWEKNVCHGARILQTFFLNQVQILLQQNPLLAALLEVSIERLDWHFIASQLLDIQDWQCQCLSMPTLIDSATRVVLFQIQLTQISRSIKEYDQVPALAEFAIFLSQMCLDTANAVGARGAAEQTQESMYPVPNELTKFLIELARSQPDLEQRLWQYHRPLEMGMEVCEWFLQNLCASCPEPVKAVVRTAFKQVDWEQVGTVIGALFGQTFSELPDDDHDSSNYRHVFWSWVKSQTKLQTPGTVEFWLWHCLTCICEWGGYDQSPRESITWFARLCQGVEAQWITQQAITQWRYIRQN